MRGFVSVMGGGELYPGEEADLALAGAGEMEATEKEPLLEKPAAAAAAGKIAGGKGEVTLGRGLVGLGGALVVGMCLVSLAAPHHLPRALASPERRRMLDAFDAVQTAAGGEWTDEDMHWHAETISPLPLMERLKRHYGVSGHDHHHPQGDAYAPLPRADGRRGLQEDGGGMLTEQTTERLKIKVDYSNMSPDDAMPYATCFEVGAWFKWNFPTSDSPPCAEAVDVQQRGIDTWSTWVASGQNSCSGAADVYGPSNLGGQMCNREYDASAQNCWGVCLQEDVLKQEAESAVATCDRGQEECQYLCDSTKVINEAGGKDIGDDCDETCCGYEPGDDKHPFSKECQASWTSQCQCGHPSYCNMNDWARENIDVVVAETENYLRARRRAGNLVLERSQGIYSSIYLQKGIPPEEACARDAQLMYRVPVDDSYCSTGFDGDVIFYPVMSQYAPGVGGWGGDAGKDETGRPIILVMGWSVATTPIARLEKQKIGAPRSIILHEIVHGLGFSVYNFRDRRDANGNIDSMVEERSVPDDTEPVWFVTSERTLTVARDYFGCPELDGLPLMGDNQLGTGSRGSHWETRIMNDEFMAYGDGSDVSGMTIAMLEDLGMYLGDYSATACMSWGKKQGCEFVTSRCASRKDFRETGGTSQELALEGNIKVQNGEGCNRHWKSGTGSGWTTTMVDRNGAETSEVLIDDLGGWNNGFRTASGACTSSRPNTIIERYCQATGCRRQWPGMETDNSKPPWACDMPSNGIEYEGVQYLCADPGGCECAAECQTTNPENGQYWGPEPTDCSPTLGPVAAAQSRGFGGFFDNPIEDYPLIIASVMLVIALFFAASVRKCIKTLHFSCLVGTSILIFVIFIIASMAVLVMTIYAYFFFDDLDEIVSKNAWLYLIGLASGVLVFAIYGTVSVCLVTRQKGCCAKHKWALGIFCLLLFLLIVVQTLGTFVAIFWVKDSYSFSDGQYTTRGQMEGASDKTRTGLGFIDESLDKAIRDIEAVTCNSYKKCCYTIARDETAPAASGAQHTRQSGVTYLEEGAPCDQISDEAGRCNPGLFNELTQETDTALTCTVDEVSADMYDGRCRNAALGDCLDLRHDENPDLKVCEKFASNSGAVCGGRRSEGQPTLGICRPTIVDADSTFTCVASHAGSSVGAAANQLSDPSNPNFCQLLSGNNRKGITPTGALCYAMEKAGVLEGMKPDGEDEDSDGDGSLEQCAADFCDSGVSGYENYVSGIFGWVHEQVVPIGIMTGLLGMLEFLQLCVCLGMLTADQKDLHEGFDGAKKWAIEEERKIASKVRHPRRHHEQGSRRTAGRHDQSQNDVDVPPPSMPPEMP